MIDQDEILHRLEIACNAFLAREDDRPVEDYLGVIDNLVQEYRRSLLPTMIVMESSDRSSRLEQIAESLQKLGKKMQSAGCWMVLFVSIPLCLLLWLFMR